MLQPQALWPGDTACCCGHDAGLPSGLCTGLICSSLVGCWLQDHLVCRARMLHLIIIPMCADENAICTARLASIIRPAQRSWYAWEWVQVHNTELGRCIFLIKSCKRASSKSFPHGQGLAKRRPDRSMMLCTSSGAAAILAQ